MTEKRTPHNFYICKLCGERVNKQKAGIAHIAEKVCAECYKLLPYCPIINDRCHTKCAFFKVYADGEGFECLLVAALLVITLSKKG